MKRLLFIVFLSVACFVNAQTPLIDSLKKALTLPVQNDTMRVVQYNELAWNYLDYSVEKAAYYQQKGYTFARKIHYLDGELDALNTKGIILRYTNKSDEAIALYYRIIAERKKQGKRDKLIGAYSNLGSVYYETGNTAYALRYYKKAFDLSVLYKQEEKQLTLLTNLGVAYKNAGLYDQALETFQKGLRLNRKFKDEFEEAQLYLNIATVYDERKLYKEAIRYNEHALKIYRKQSNPRSMGIVLYNLATEYRSTRQFQRVEKVIREMETISRQLKEDEFDCSLAQVKAGLYHETNRETKALAEIEKALQLVDTVSDMYLYSELLLTKADILLELKQVDKALVTARAGIVILEQIDDPMRLSKAYLTLADIEKGSGNFKEALRLVEKANELSTKSTLAAIDEQIATLNVLNELDRKEQDLQLANHKNKAAIAKNEKQANLIWAGGLIGLLVLVLLLFSIRSNRNKRKTNRLLKEQKSEIEEQKQTVDEKQREILDSIHYAKRIQQTLLAQQEHIHHFVSDACIYFKPKDIVSGDFYWSADQGEYFFLAVCDSTGHGVPGAFMSVLNISFLSEAINELRLTDPGQILDHVRNRLIAYISHSGAQDGMDGVLFAYHKQDGRLTYSAAYNAPVVIRGGECLTFEADRMPIGKSDKLQPFTTREIDLQPNDVVYAYTDGYPDQFGGEKGKKFKTKKLNEFLTSIAGQPFQIQYGRLSNGFENWRGDYEQVDDVTVIGVRF
ncbi:MAG TPA: tetratricopeptide repeat protein [Fluviicola sp.]|nr:tetratricopeptide repeat protein [Fluviicola sp.]